MNTLDVITTIATCLSAIAMVATAIIATVQLSKMNKTINDGNLMSNFEIEFELNKRKERLAELRSEIEKYVAEHDSDSESVKKVVEIMDKHYDESLENYLNIFDRLCYYILKNRLNDDDFRTEYRERLNAEIKAFSKQFGPGTRYRNMLNLNALWQSK